MCGFGWTPSDRSERCRDDSSARSGHVPEEYTRFQTSGVWRRHRKDAKLDTELDLGGCEVLS